MNNWLLSVVSIYGLLVSDVALLDNMGGVVLLMVIVVNRGHSVVVSAFVVMHRLLMVSGDEVHVMEMSIVTVISMSNARMPVSRVRLRVFFVNLSQRLNVVVFNSVTHSRLQCVVQIVIFQLDVPFQLGAAVVSGVVVEVVRGVRVSVGQARQRALISVVIVIEVAQA